MDSKPNDPEVIVLEDTTNESLTSDSKRLFGNDTTRSRHCHEISNIRYLKEFSNSDINLTNEEKLHSMNPKINYRNNITRMNDFGTILVKEEVDTSVTDLPNDHVHFSKDFGTRNDTVACSSEFELHNGAHSKELALFSNIDCKKEQIGFTLDLVKKIKKEPVMNNGEISVKEIPTKNKSQLEAWVSNFFEEYENRDGKLVALGPTEPSRLSINETPEADIMIIPQIVENVQSLRSKNFESGKNCNSASHSKQQDLISDSGIQQMTLGKISPEKTSPKLPNAIPEEDKITKCDFCQKSLTQYYLKAHMLSHKGVKPYECTICNKRFTQLAFLKTHNMRHEGKKQFYCEVCRKGFVLLTDLKRHQMRHWEKPYKCNLCKDTFNVLSQFRAHLSIHEGKKPLECNICKKSFIWPSHLKIHHLIHEGKKPHQCSVCKKSYSQLSNLRAHSRTHQRK